MPSSAEKIATTATSSWTSLLAAHISIIITCLFVSVWWWDVILAILCSFKRPFFNSWDEMSSLHHIIVMPVGLFLAWPLFDGGGLTENRPHSAVAAWYICYACDLMWRPLGGCFTEPSSILFSPRWVGKTAAGHHTKCFPVCCFQVRLQAETALSVWFFSSTRWELCESKFRHSTSLNKINKKNLCVAALKKPSWNGTACLLLFYHVNNKNVI